MSNRIISPLSTDTKIVKSRLVQTINEAVDEVNKIHELYDKFFTAPAPERPTLAKKIENQLESIKSKYIELFAVPEGGASKIQELDASIENIRQFHRELTSGEDAIKTDILDSQEKITDFYIKLFTTYETENDGGQEAKLKAAFDSITSFDETLNKDDVGYKAKIEKAKNEILAAHKNLLEQDATSGLSKVDVLNQHIAEANDFHTKLTDEISPFLAQKQKDIDEISDDIQTKRKEVDSLLSETTVKALAQGYREAMQIYGDPVYGQPNRGWKQWLKHRTACLFKAIKHFIKFTGSYVLFIGPLVLIGWLFVSNGWQTVLDATPAGNVEFSGTEYIFYKLTIALPLLWVSWYGQKNIAHRKRLFEEYNHKLRVVQMYMHFVANDSTYTLEPGSRTRLENTLLDTIERNPSEVYGKDETLLDKFLDALKGRGTEKAKKNSPAPSPDNPIAETA